MIKMPTSQIRKSELSLIWLVSVEAPHKGLRGEQDWKFLKTQADKQW